MPIKRDCLALFGALRLKLHPRIETARYVIRVSGSSVAKISRFPDYKSSLEMHPLLERSYSLHLMHQFSSKMTRIISAKDLRAKLKHSFP